MSKITKSLHYQKTNGTSGTCALYTSKADCAGYSTINLEVDGANVYAGLGTSLTANNASGIRIQKNGSSTKYAILKWTQAAMNITQVANQTIRVTNASGTAVSTGTLLPMNTALTITCTPATGYKASSPTINGTTVSNPYRITQANIEAGSFTLSCTAAAKQTFTFYINQSDHQTITVTCNGVAHTSTFTATYGDKWTATITPDTGYNAGTLTSTSGTITDSVTIAATAAAIKTFTLSFGATTNQTYVATVDGVAKAATASATSYTVNYGTTYSVAYTANSATNAYTYTASNSVSGTVTNTTSIPAKSASASLRYYTLTVPATANQSYNLRLATNSSYGGTLPSYTTTATKSSQTLSVPYGTTYSISYTADSGYNPGSAKSGTVNGNTTVSHNAATVATATVTIVQSANQTIHVYTPQKSGGTDHTSTFTCPIGTTYEAEVVAASGYLPGDLSVK
jgi:hypothetical protein